MRRSLVGMAAVLLSSVIGAANEKPPVVQEVIHATPEKIKKAAVSMFAPDGYAIDSDKTALAMFAQAYRIDSDKASVLRISREWSSEETSSFNTEHWTDKPVSNCRRVLTFILLPGDQAISLTMRLGTECHADRSWLIRMGDNEKNIQWMQTSLANLKTKIEAADQRH
jgi:hypothetical protein